MGSNAAPRDCAFCAIGRGEDTTAAMVAEAADWCAFFPRSPATPGHTLLIPRLHVENLWTLEGPLRSELMDAIIRVGRAIDEGLQPEGMNVISSAGEVAEQTVFHLHFHLLPRWSDDRFGPIWQEAVDGNEWDLMSRAAQIRVAFLEQG